MLRIAVVGAGIRGSLFTRALAQHPAATVVAVCDRNDGLARQRAAQFAIAAFGAHEEMLAADLDLDAVVVATPDFAHRDAAVAAAEAGLHLLIEKPLATTLEDAQAIVDAAKKADVRTMLGYENRWNPRLLSARELLTSGQLGELVGQIVHLNDTVFVPTEMLSWSAGSSPVWFLMPHSLDLVLWLSGKTPRSIFAQGVRTVLAARGIDTWDSVDACIAFTDGTTATLHSTWVLPVSYPAVYDFRYELVGSRGALRIEGAEQGLQLMSDKLSWPQWNVHEVHGRIHGYPVEMAYTFVDHLLGVVDDVPTVTDGMKVTTILAAIDESLTTGRPVSLT